MNVSLLSATQMNPSIINEKNLKIICLHSKQQIESFLRQNTFLHLYSIGDLDDFFWNYTSWYGLLENEEIRAIALLYTAFNPPNLLALAEENDPFLPELLRSILHLLPGRFYAHLSPKLEIIFAKDYQLESYGTHYKMSLTDQFRLVDIDTSQVIRLSTIDLDELLDLYSESYPDSWFDPRMLETNQFFGIREKGRLISVAGIHVYSAKYRVAAVGNITTQPDFRGRGFGRRTTTKLCQSLLNSVDHIGLNVKTDNISAIKCYEKLGFEVIAKYEEAMLVLK